MNEKKGCYGVSHHTEIIHMWASCSMILQEEQWVSQEKVTFMSYKQRKKQRHWYKAPWLPLQWFYPLACTGSNSLTCACLTPYWISPPKMRQTCMHAYHDNDICIILLNLIKHSQVFILFYLFIFPFCFPTWNYSHIEKQKKLIANV